MSAPAGYYDTSYPPSIYSPPEPPPDTRMPVAPNATVSNPVIEAMPPANQLAAINNAYVGNPATVWNVADKATIATNIVTWNGVAWVAFVLAQEDEPLAVVDEPPPPAPEVNE